MACLPVQTFLVLTLCAAIATSAKWSSFCPGQCVCNDNELSTECKDKALEAVPLTFNPFTKKISLPKNNIVNIDQAFGIYSQVEIIDLSFNRITRLRSEGLQLTQLQILNLGFNTIEVIEQDAFLGLENLLELSLKKNSLSELPANVFMFLRNLKVLDLSHNKISSIHHAAFQGLVSLEKLILRSNSLRHAPSDSFASIKNVRSLDLGSNSLAMLDQSAFNQLSKLEQLSLDKCAIGQIHLEAFQGVSSIKELNIQYNNLQVFPRAISKLPKLEQLNIGGNLMTKISNTDLKDLKKIKKLVLGQSERLERIEQDAFQHTPELEELWMEFNLQLEHLPDNVFSRLNQLKKLSLRGNNIKYMHPDLIPVHQLESFDVSKNPLECNCSLSWLWKHLNSERFQEEYHNSSSVRCHGPSHLHMELVKSLDHLQLECTESQSISIVFLILGLCVLCACILAIIVILYLRGKSQDHIKTATIIKDIDSSPVEYARYDGGRKYPYVIQPYTGTVPYSNCPVSSSMMNHNSKYAEAYASLNANALQGYIMSLSYDAALADTSNRLYQTLNPKRVTLPPPMEHPAQHTENPLGKYLTLNDPSRKQSSSLIYV